MSYPYSCLVHRTKGILRPKLLAEHSHAMMLIEHGIKDTDQFLHRKNFLKVTAAPPKGSSFFKIPLNNFVVEVDMEAVSGELPDWWLGQQAQWEKKVLRAAANWIEQGKITAGENLGDLHKVLGVSK